MNIGTIDCGTSSSLCKEVGYSDDLVYFKGDIGPGKGEVCFIVLLFCTYNPCTQLKHSTVAQLCEK